MKKQTEILFFFDTEDYTSEIAAEAIKREADILTDEGITGHFSMVGLVCEALEKWGRRDIIDSLAPHIIGTHTYGHTMHPTVMELSDFFDFDQSYHGIASYEDRALSMIRKTFPGKQIMFACPPGNSKSYAAMYYYADRGIPFYCDSVVYDHENSSLGFCNIEHICYESNFDGMAMNERHIDEVFERLVTKERAILYTHPNMAVKTEFWDTLNYKYNNLHTPEDYIEAPDRPKEEIDRYFKGMRTLIRRLKEDDRFRFTDLNEILSSRKERPALRKSDIPVILSELKKEFAPVGAFSLSDIFLAARSFLMGAEEYTPGKVYGFLAEPYRVTAPFTAAKEEILKAAAELDVTRFLPDAVMIGEHLAGPADLLFAMLEVLSGAETVSVIPRDQLISLDNMEELRDFRPAGTWMHSREFRDIYASDRLRYQCWTLFHLK